MDLTFRWNRFIKKFSGVVNKKVELLPEQQVLLDNWSQLLKEKNSKQYHYRVDNIRTVVSYEDIQESNIRKMISLKEGGVFYNLTFTEVKQDGSTVIIDADFDPQIAKQFIDKFDDTMFRKIVNLEKKRKTLIQEQLEIKTVEVEEPGSSVEELDTKVFAMAN